MADERVEVPQRRFGDFERRVIVMCDEGCQSSLVAAALQRLGFDEETDPIGGYQAWRAAGLPIETCGE